MPPTPPELLAQQQHQVVCIHRWVEVGSRQRLLRLQHEREAGQHRHACRQVARGQAAGACVTKRATGVMQRQHATMLLVCPWGCEGAQPTADKYPCRGLLLTPRYTRKRTAGERLTCHQESHVHELKGPPHFPTQHLQYGRATAIRNHVQTDVRSSDRQQQRQGCATAGFGPPPGRRRRSSWRAAHNCSARIGRPSVMPSIARPRHLAERQAHRSPDHCRSRALARNAASTSGAASVALPHLFCEP